MAKSQQWCGDAQFRPRLSRLKRVGTTRFKFLLRFMSLEIVYYNFPRLGFVSVGVCIHYLSVRYRSGYWSKLISRLPLSAPCQWSHPYIHLFSFRCTVFSDMPANTKKKGEFVVCAQNKRKKYARGNFNSSHLHSHHILYLCLKQLYVPVKCSSGIIHQDSIWYVFVEKHEVWLPQKVQGHIYFRVVGVGLKVAACVLHIVPPHKVELFFSVDFSCIQGWQLATVTGGIRPRPHQR